MKQSSDFEYLRSAATRVKDLYFLDDIEAAVSSFDRDELDLFRSAYDDIARKEDTFELSRWIDRYARPKVSTPLREVEFARSVGRLFVIFEHLAEREIEPFRSRSVRLIEEIRHPDWSHLPGELRYLEEVAVRLERFPTEGNPEDLPYADLQLLKDVGERIAAEKHMAAINSWLDRFDMVEHREAWLVYRVIGFLDSLGMVN